MTSGPTLPLEIGRSKVLLPTVNVEVLPWDAAIVRSPMRSLRKACVTTSTKQPAGEQGALNVATKWVAYCCVRCKAAPSGPVLTFALPSQQACLRVSEPKDR